MDSLTIENLSDDKSIKQLVSDYWERDEEDNFKFKVTEIANKYEVKAPIINITINKECVVYSNAIACKNCKSPYEIRNRTHYKSKNLSPSWLCSECEQEEVEFQNQQKEKILDKKFKDAMSLHQNIEDYSLIQLLCLYSILEYTNNDYKSEIKPYNTVASNSKLSPTKALDSWMYSELITKDILTINPLRNYNKVQYFDNENVDYLWAEVSLLPTIHGYDNNLADTVERIQSILYEKRWSGKHLDDAKLICSNLLINEAIAFAYYLSGSKDFQFTSENYMDIFMLVVKLIKVYKVSQINNLIWRASKDAEKYYFEKRQDSEMAGSVFIKSLTRMTDYALKDQWKIKPLTRNSNTPVSIISEIFFNGILSVEEYGFNQLPSDII
jgi:hypothetical protein